MSLPSGSKTFTLASPNTATTLTSSGQFAYAPFGSVSAPLGFQFSTRDSTGADISSWFSQASAVVDTANTPAWLTIKDSSNNIKAVIQSKYVAGRSTIIPANPAFVIAYKALIMNPMYADPVSNNRVSVETGVFTDANPRPTTSDNGRGILEGGSVTSTSLVPGQQYTFSWSATNPLPQLETPSAPVVAKTSTAGQLSVQFTGVSNGDTYTIEYTAVGGTSWTTRSSTATPGTTYQINALAGPTGVRIKANATTNGLYLASNPSTSVTATPLLQLSPPGSLSVNRTLNTGELSVSFNNVLNASNYTIQTSSDGVTWLTATTIPPSNGATTSTLLTGMGSSPVHVRVAASGDPSLYTTSNYTMASPTTPLIKLATPTIEVAATATAGEISVDITNPDANATTYVIEYSTTATGPWTPVTPEESIEPRTITGLSGLTYVRVQMNGTNGYADSDYSNIASATPLAQLGPPTIDSVEKTSQVGQLTVTWGGVPNASSYLVEKQNGTSWVSAGTTNSATTTLTVSGLTGETSFRVTAKSADQAAFQDSAPSAGVSGTPLLKLATPTGLTAEANLTIGDLVISWASVPNAVSYLIETRVGTGSWAPAATPAAADVMALLTGLTSAVSVRITAIGNGTTYVDSDASQSLTGTPLLDGGGGGGGGDGAVCFLADAPVLTPAGYRPISAIAAGDLVRTAGGLNVAVKRVFRKEYVAGASVNPYVIPKGSFGALRALPISPNHEVMTARGMVQAKDLGLPRMKMAGSFTYYNLELEDWTRDNLVVAGVECESLAPAARVTMSKAEFTQFVKARYGPAAAARLKTACYLKEDGRVSMPAFR